MQENAATPSLDADWHRLRPELDNVMDELSDPDRDAVLLRFFGERTFADIGVTLRISEDAARVRVGRALDKLRALLAKRGIASTAAALAAVLTNQAAATVPDGVATAVSSTLALSAAATRPDAILQAAKNAPTTLTQKTFAALATPAVVGGLFYQAQVQRVQTAQTGSLERLVADWQRQARQLRADRDRIRAQTPPSTVTRNAARENDPELDARLRALLAQAAKLKRRMNARPDQQIPELNYLTPKDWLATAQEFSRLETDDDFSRALSSVRTQAKNNFAALLKEALDAYLLESKNELPGKAADLARFFSAPVPPAIWSRYEMRSAGNARALSGETIVIEEKASAIDPRYDNLGIVTLDSSGVTTTPPESPPDGILPEKKAALERAVETFREAHSGKGPEIPEEIIPYLAGSDADLAEVLKELGRKIDRYQFSEEARNQARQLFRADRHGAYPQKPEELTPYFQEAGDAAKYLDAVKEGFFSK